jgi:hypothetical protein
VASAARVVRIPANSRYVETPYTNALVRNCGVVRSRWIVSECTTSAHSTPGKKSRTTRSVRTESSMDYAPIREGK